MSTHVSLIAGLGGAIGSDFRASRNALLFVEFDGKVSRLNLVRPLLAIVSQGVATIDATHSFDFDTGAEAVTRDVFWDTVSGDRRLRPTNGAQLALLGQVPYTTVSHADLQGLTYSADPLNGNAGPDNDLATNNVFAVLTTDGNYAKVRVDSYGANLQLRWTTYQLGPRYQILGTGYDQPEDIKVSSDEMTAFVTERSGNLVRVNLANANRPFATVVASGMTAPHQIWLDEVRNQAYVVEYNTPGRLLRIDLASGVQTTLIPNLDRAIGLLLTQDLAFAYVSEQSSGPEGGRVSRITLATGHRQTLASGLTAPFFLTWADAGESAILLTERDPANRVTRLNLNDATPSTTVLAGGVAFRPSSVAAMNPTQLLVCSDDEISQLDLTGSVYLPTGPMLLGIGHVPVDRIFGGYADTMGDPGYFFQVKDSPFGGSLPIMVNHERAYAEGARYYKLEVDGTEPRQSWSDYRWSTSTNSFVLHTVNPSATGYYPVRQPNQLFYTPHLGYWLDTSGLANGAHTISLRLFAGQSAATEIGTAASPGRSAIIELDNSWPQVSIDRVWHDGSTVGTCAIVTTGSDEFSFDITAHDAQGHLLSWSLSALWGDNKSAGIASDDYSAHISPSRLWAGIVPSNATSPGDVPAPAWHATVPGDPTSTRCAHTFVLGAWDRVINGYGYIHYATYHKSITLLLP